VGLVEVERALVDWVWLWATVRRTGDQEQRQVAIISHLGQGDAAGATRVEDGQDAGVSLRPATRALSL
jgi:hypothetical protein